MCKICWKIRFGSRFRASDLTLYTYLHNVYIQYNRKWEYDDDRKMERNETKDTIDCERFEGIQGMKLDTHLHASSFFFL